MQREASSPGKLILSGEHAVVAGCPALAMAVNLHARVRVQPLPEPILRIALPNRPSRSYPLDRLLPALNRAREQHRLYLAEQRDFQTIQQEPEDLLSCCAAMAAPTGGVELQFSSTLPLGSGLGSSAAFILCLLKALQPAIPNPELEKQAVEGEHFQHGRSSGLDVAVSLRGGLQLFHEGNCEPCPTPLPLPAFRVFHSSTPENSTGECVQQSQQIFRRTPGLPQAFRQCTQETREALQQQNGDAWSDAIRENHRLLCNLGVVPPAVQKVISALEQSGGAAKVCGAGSLNGLGAGMILVRGGADFAFPDHWQELPLQISPQGTTLIS